MPIMLDIEPLINGYKQGQQIMENGMCASTINDEECGEIVVALMHPKLWRYVNTMLNNEVGMATDPRSDWDGQTKDDEENQNEQDR